MNTRILAGILSVALLFIVCKGDLVWQRVLSKAPWGARAMPRGGLKGDYIYVIGGRAGALTFYGDTWRSNDGEHWELQSDKQGWGKRAYPAVAVVGDSLILTGGQGLFTFYNDVWRSDDDGRNWIQVNKDAPFGKRAGHFMLVVEEDILLFAGAKNSFGRSFYNELWISHDKGSTWTLQSQLPEDMGRAGMQVVHLNGSLYFMGGDHDNPVFKANFTGRRNDVWKSDDLGVTWENLGNAAWSPRTGHQCGLLDETIYCLGGEGQDSGNGNKPVLFHDVWSWSPLSNDVGDWTLESSGAWGCAESEDRCGRDDFLLVADDNKLWTFGGDEETSAPYPQDNDVWVAELM